MSENTQPNTLAEAVEILEKELSPDSLYRIRNMDKDDLAGMHHTLGRHLRNNWGLWTEDAPLKKHMMRLGFTHPDDMSSVILESLWHKLNNMPYDVKAKVQEFQDYWKRVQEFQDYWKRAPKK